MSDIEFVKKKRWEGKPFKFKLKYLVANYPELALSSLCMTIVLPLIAFYRIYTFEGGRTDVIKKFKSTYMVVRDDHPNIQRILAEKEAGKEFFPKY